MKGMKRTKAQKRDLVKQYDRAEWGQKGKFLKKAGVAASVISRYRAELGLAKKRPAAKKSA